MNQVILGSRELTLKWYQGWGSFCPQKYSFRNFTLISSSKIIIISLASSSISKVPISLEILLKHFIICLQVVRGVDRSKKILLNALFFIVIVGVFGPHRNSVSLQSSPDLNSTNVVLSLKLIPNDGEEQIFPKSVGVALLNPDVPSSSLLTLFVLPKRLDSLLKEVVGRLLLKFVWSE